MPLKVDKILGKVRENDGEAFSTTATSGNVTIDANSGNIFTIKPTDTITLAMSNLSSGQSIKLMIVDGGTNINFPSDWNWPDSTVPELTPAGCDIIEVSAIDYNGDILIMARHVQQLTADDAYLVLEALFNGDDASTDFIDDSTYEHIITGYNTAQLDTAIKNEGTAALLLADGDYVEIADSDAFDMGTGDFTVTFDVYASATQTAATPMPLTTKIGWASGHVSIRWNNLTINVSGYDTGPSLLVSSALTAEAWHKVKLTRSGTTFELYVDDNLEDTATSSASIDFAAGGGLRLGRCADNGTNFIGSIDNVKIYKGVAL